jgi:hypothetical protein
MNRSRISIAINEDLELAIDRWRGSLPRVPNRAEAIRRLIQFALDRVGGDPALGVQRGG